MIGFDYRIILIINTVKTSLFIIIMGEIKFFVNEIGKMLKPHGLDTLILYVTSRCNAKCNFCFYGDELNRIPELSLEQITMVSQKLGGLNGLLIGGGEPFLRVDLFDIISAFIKNCGIEVVQIPTNGYFVDRTVSFIRRITTSFPQLNIGIQVSIDAIGEGHDKVRQLKGSFKRAEETALALLSLRDKRSHLRVLVVSVLTPQTVATCRELADYVRKNIRPDYHWFEPVRDMPDMEDNLHLPEDTITYLRDNLNYYLTKIKNSSSSIYASQLFNQLIKEFSLNNFNIAYNRFVHKKCWPVFCCAGKRMAVLYPDGILAACELRKESVNIKDYDFDINRALEDAIFEKVREDIRHHACDCTQGCFIPTSVRYSPFELLKIFWKSTIRD